MKTSKWYWYIPLISIFFLPEVAIWIVEAEDASERTDRNNIVQYILFPLHMIAMAVAASFFIHSQY
jgi:hypothetical protein